MVRKSRVLSLLGLAVAVGSLSGCLSTAGNYAGYVSELHGEAADQHPVQLNIGRPEGDVIQVSVSENSSHKLLRSTFEIRVSGHQATIEGLSAELPQVVLVQDKNSQCWRSSNPAAFACLDAAGFQAQVSISAGRQLRFWTNKGAAVPRAAINSGQRRYSVDELRRLSVRGSFNNRMEFEALLQAKKQAELTQRALAPRLSVNGAMNWYMNGLVGAIEASISEVAPFLFPSNWFAAKSDERTARATAVATRLMKLDTMFQVESLCASIARDQGILAAYRHLLSESAPMRNQIADREKLGQYPAGSVNNVDYLLMNARADATLIEQMLVEERRNLAQMVGLSDLNSIESIDWAGDHQPIAHPPVIDHATYVERAVRVAPEILQIQDLVEAAQMKLKQSTWSWLDPNGGPSTGIGLGLSASIGLSKATLAELQVQSEQTESLIRQKAENSATELADSRRSYELSGRALAINIKRRDKEFDKVKLGVDVDFFGLVQILQDQLKSEMDVQTALANYRTAKASLDRVLLLSAYSN